MRLLNKLKWVASIVMIFGVILATNLIDKDNFAKVEASVDAIYEDVLLTKDRILEMNMIVHEMELAFVLEDETYYETKASTAQDRIYDLLADCEKVVETKQEENLLIDLQDNLGELFKVQLDSTSLSEEGKNQVIQQFEMIRYNIVELGEIHVEEGRKHKMKSRSVMGMTKLFSRIEIYLLVFLALAMLFVILFQPKEKSEE